MTDRDIIRAEIERLKECCDYNEENAYDKILSFIDSMEEESVSEDLEKIVEEIAEPTILNAYGTKELAKRLRNTIYGTSVSEGLEEASKNHAVERFRTTRDEFLAEKCKWSFEAGAKWQKGKDEFITEDLGEYINELSKQFPEVSFAKLSRIAVRVAKWQKEQMMAKAIDGHVTFEFYGLDSKTYGTIAHDPICLDDLGLKDTDKVKIIVIKED